MAVVHAFICEDDAKLLEGVNAQGRSNKLMKDAKLPL